MTWWCKWHIYIILSERYQAWKNTYYGIPFYLKRQKENLFRVKEVVMTVVTLERGNAEERQERGVRVSAHVLFLDVGCGNTSMFTLWKVIKMNKVFNLYCMYIIIELKVYKNNFKTNCLITHAYNRLRFKSTSWQLSVIQICEWTGGTVE